MPGGRPLGIRGIPNEIVRGQMDMTSDEATYIKECARLVFGGGFKGSLRDAINLVVRDYCSIFNPDEAYCINQDDIDLLLKRTESGSLSEAFAKIARKELNGQHRASITPSQKGRGMSREGYGKLVE
ncbi:Uncharacterised protein [uncultured archaeon]|nr:Uncharacterised protein [uncultured archaeon]